MANSADYRAWFDDLPPATREWLMANPDSPIPPEHLDLLLRTETGRVVMAHFVEQVPTGFRLSSEIRQWIDDHGADRPTGH
jgi:hypothetical protein